MRRVRSIDQKWATYLRGLEVVESTCCTVEVSTWCLPANGPACTELVLLSLEDDDKGSGEDSDVTLLSTAAGGVVPPPCVGKCEGGVRLVVDTWDNVGEEPSGSATGLRGVTGDIRMPTSSVAISEETLAVLAQQPMMLKSEEKLDI